MSPAYLFGSLKPLARISYLFALLVLLFPQSSLSHTLHASREDYSLFLQRLSPTEGLSQSEVTQITQDNLGFIWIATRMGLNRYDGYKIKRVSGPESRFEQEEIYALHLGEQGYMWVSTVASGIYRVNPLTLEAEQFTDGFMPKSNKPFSVVADFEQNDPNHLWLALDNSVQRFNIETRRYEEFFLNQFREDWVTDIYVRNNKLIVASVDGLRQIDIQSKQVDFIKHTPANMLNERSLFIKDLKFDKQLGLLVSTREGLYRFPDVDNLLNASPQVLVPDLNVWDIERANNVLYLATDQGLIKFNPDTNQLNPIIKYSRSSFRASDDNVTDLFKDKTGNYWLGSRSQGALKWADVSTRFHHINSMSEPRLSHENTWKMVQDKNGIIWVATDNGLSKIDLEANTSEHFLNNPVANDSSGNNLIVSVFVDEQNDEILWVQNELGLYIFDKNTGKLSPPPVNEKDKELLHTRYLYGLYVQDARHIFFFSDLGHYHYDSEMGKVFPLSELDKQLDPLFTWSFMEPLPNRPYTVLVVTSGHLYEYNLRENKLTLIYKVTNFQPQTYDTVESWLVDGDTLWLANTGEGLVGLDINTFEKKYHFNTHNHLDNNQIYQLLMDDFGQIWISSQYGLYKLNKERDHFEVFYAGDGLLSSEFNSGSALALQDGQFAFGSPLGINYFDPKDFAPAMNTDQHYTVHLTDIKLFSEETANVLNRDRDTITLKHNQYGLKLTFSTLEFRKQGRTNYSIKLEGPQSLVLPDFSSNEVILPKLEPGHYQLNISATSAKQGTVINPLTLSIIVQSSPWLTHQAKVGYASIIFLLSFLFYMSRKRKQQELVELHERTKASRDRMQMALFGSNSGIWDYWLEQDTIYAEHTPKHLEGEVLSVNVPMKEFGKLINPAQFAEMKARWYRFLNGETQNWDVTYQIQGRDGEWPWYRVVGRVIACNEEGKPTRVIGTYTDITETKKSEDKAGLFGEAFSQINDWVLILNEHLVPVTANDAFKQLFNIESDVTPNVLKQLLDSLGEEKYREFKEIILRLAPKESWQGEEVVITPDNNRHPVLVKIHAIARRQNIICHYVIVVSDISQQKVAEEKLRHLAHYDYLTDLPNRQLLFEKIEKHITQKQSPFALLFIDLDKFKQVNDLYGHFVGDQLLKTVANILLTCVQHKDVVARQSGDEFVIMIEQFHDINEVSHVAQKILDKLEETIVLDDLHVHITSSVGIAIYPDDSDCAIELIKKADLAMIHAKNAGRGEFQFFTQDMNEKAHVRLTLENDLKRACSENAFVNFYQPIVSASQNKMVGVELLLRWFDKDKMISPGVFIPIAEEVGLISQMTLQAIEKALNDYKNAFMHATGFYISINLSPIHILQEGLGESLMSALNRHKLPPQVLRLEITESTLLSDLDVALRRLDELRLMGFKLLLDDFGTGYSSMGYLSKFSIDYIKIDKSFIHALENKTNRSIVDSIVTLAKNLDLDCIVEGVETQEQLDYMRRLDCDLIQGYFYSKPLPVNELIALELFNKGNSEKMI